MGESGLDGWFGYQSMKTSSPYSFRSFLGAVQEMTKKIYTTRTQLTFTASTKKRPFGGSVSSREVLLQLLGFFTSVLPVNNVFVKGFRIRKHWPVKTLFDASRQHLQDDLRAISNKWLYSIASRSVQQVSNEYKWSSRKDSKWGYFSIKTKKRRPHLLIHPVPSLLWYLRSSPASAHQLG